jgi:hypothetical protein
MRPGWCWTRSSRSGHRSCCHWGEATVGGYPSPPPWLRSRRSRRNDDGRPLSAWTGPPHHSRGATTRPTGSLRSMDGPGARTSNHSARRLPRTQDIRAETRRSRCVVPFPSAAGWPQDGGARGTRATCRWSASRQRPATVPGLGLGWRGSRRASSGSESRSDS